MSRFECQPGRGFKIRDSGWGKDILPKDRSLATQIVPTVFLMRLVQESRHCATCGKYKMKSLWKRWTVWTSFSPEATSASSFWPGGKRSNLWVNTVLTPGLNGLKSHTTPALACDEEFWGFLTTSEEASESKNYHAGCSVITWFISDVVNKNAIWDGCRTVVLIKFIQFYIVSD